MRRNLACFLFVIAVVLNLAALYGFYRIALDMRSSAAARFGGESPEVVHVDAPLPASFEAALTKPVEAERYSDEEKSTRVLVTFTAYRLLASDGKVAGDLSLKVPGS